MKKLTFLAGLLTLSSQAGALPQIVNCAGNAQNPRCVSQSMPDGAGTVGSGPTFYQGGSSDDLRGGFVTADGKKLIVAINTLSITGDKFGAVMEVDLDTGNRRVISGHLNAVESRGQGVPSGSYELYDLGNVNDVNPLPGGDLVAYSAGQAIRIDSRTGNRSLLWTSKTSSDISVRDGAERKYAAGALPGASGAVPTPNLNVSTPLGNVNLGSLFGGGNSAPAPVATGSGHLGNGYFCPQFVASERMPAIPRPNMATDAQGNIYLLHDNNPQGSGFALFKLDASKDYRCTVVSQFGTQGNNVKGSGLPWTTNVTSSGPLFGDLTLVGDTVYAAGGPNPNYVVVSINTKTGERALVSGQRAGNGIQAFKKGSGDAMISDVVVHSGGALYTTEEQVNSDSFSLVRIDPKTGDRTAVPVKPNTPLATGFSSDIRLYSIPNSTNLLVWFRDALHLLDPKTGDNMILSR
ncbi:hypothetical protein GCM10017783_02480 [Deinococcus piscis]|uniref:Uncharacterized protein n=1 Tax=Deinococcus piscis TaxID=394230 RepID=A0ABQ3JX40_9DEIO|nr:hypothetical protein [Deinococcus piscis]GHF93987.1 hypothetical protein GCM10017783_02480 [Deinococcus piscis]